MSSDRTDNKSCVSAPCTDNSNHRLKVRRKQSCFNTQNISISGAGAAGAVFRHLGFSVCPTLTINQSRRNDKSTYL